MTHMAWPDKVLFTPDPAFLTNDLDIPVVESHPQGLQL